MELNFFDTAYNMSLNIFLLGGFSFVSKYGHDNAETGVAVEVFAIVAAEIEQSAIGINVVTATTLEERTVRIREDRSITVPARATA